MSCTLVEHYYTCILVMLIVNLNIVTGMVQSNIQVHGQLTKRTTGQDMFCKDTIVQLYGNVQ